VELQVLKGISFEVKKGEFVAIMGPSGCGKSTLLHLMGCLDRPTSGSIFLEGINTSNLDDNQLAGIRNKKIGFVFQMFNLLPRMNALENVELPMVYARVKPEIRLPRSKELLEEVGIEDRAKHRPAELSGGERQRVAIARALANSPSVLLADEPTGSLDTKSGDEVVATFQKLNDAGVTIVMVSHEPDVVHHAKRMIHLVDGAITSDEPITQIRL
jgi:putative ABC transport system ATP-binding protein